MFNNYLAIVDIEFQALISKGFVDSLDKTDLDLNRSAQEVLCKARQAKHERGGR